MTGLLAVLLVVAALMALLFLAQRSFIYFPRAYSGGELQASPLQVIPLEVQTTEGRQVSYYIPPRGNTKREPRRLWVVFGGNGSLALDWLDFLTDYPDPGSAFLLVEYPGYGNSEGSASPETILEASRSAFAELTRRFSFPEMGMTGGVHLLGHSLGAGAALEFAAAMPVRSLLLVAPFTSLREMAARAVGLPLGFLLLHNFDNRARLREILVAPVVPKVVIIHGENDQVVPIEMGRALAQEFTALEYVEIPGGDHNALLMLERSLIHARMFKISGL